MPEPLKKDWKKEIRKDYHKILPEEQIEDTVKYWDEIINGALQSQKDSLLERLPKKNQSGLCKRLGLDSAIKIGVIPYDTLLAMAYNQCLEEVKKIIEEL